MPQAKLLVKFVEKPLEKLFFQCVAYEQGREGGLGVIFNRRGKFKLLALQGDPLAYFSSLV